MIWKMFPPPTQDRQRPCLSFILRFNLSRGIQLFEGQDMRTPPVTAILQRIGDQVFNLVELGVVIKLATKAGLHDECLEALESLPYSLLLFKS